MTVLFFPRLHPELVSENLPKGVKFFDPGLNVSAAGECSWRPASLPLNEREAERYIRESLGFGERFSSPSDLSYFSAGTLEDFYSRTAAAVRSEFSRSLAAEGGLEPGRVDPFLKGQMVMLLAWTLEEKSLEFKSLSERTEDLVHRFKTSLGLNGDELEELPPAPPAISQDIRSEVLPWTTILPWFLFWMTETDLLFVLDRSLVAEWREAGVVFNRVGEDALAELGLDPEKNIEQPLQRAEAPGWRLALLPGQDTNKPWLENNYTIIFYEAEGNRGQ